MSSGLMKLSESQCPVGTWTPAPKYFYSKVFINYSRVNLGESNRGASLPMNKTAQPGLALDDAIRNSHFATQGRQEHHQL